MLDSPHLSLPNILIYFSIIVFIVWLLVDKHSVKILQTLKDISEDEKDTNYYKSTNLSYEQSRKIQSLVGWLSLCLFISGMLINSFTRDESNDHKIPAEVKWGP